MAITIPSLCEIIISRKYSACLFLLLEETIKSRLVILEFYVKIILVISAHYRRFTRLRKFARVKRKVEREEETLPVFSIEVEIGG